MFKIRDGIKEDCIAIESMINELGVYENRNDGPDGSKINRQILEKDGFGENRLLRTVVAEEEGSKVLLGYALYFFKYSTYTGKSLYLEDLYVKPDYRGSGVGQALLTAVVREALQNYCDYAEWSCLPWNHQSISFYLKFGAEKQPEGKDWISFKLDRQQMESIVNKSDKTNDLLNKIESK